jgi:hypothetical protein
MKALRIAVAVVLLAALALLSGAWFAWRAAAEDVARSAAAQGVVVGVRTSRSSDGATTYAPILRFTTGGGQSVEASPTLTTSWRPAMGERWEIRYDPANPSRVWADTFLGTWFLPLLLGGIGGVALLVAGGLAVVALGRRGA